MNEFYPDHKKENLTHWVSMDQAAKICGLSKSTIRDLCAARRIDPICAKKIGRKWLFKKSILEAENLILID